MSAAIKHILQPIDEAEVTVRQQQSFVPKEHQKSDGEEEIIDKCGLKGVDKIIKQWKFFALMSKYDENLNLPKGAWILYQVRLITRL